MSQATETRQRKIWALPHNYSCGGYWLAEFFGPDRSPVIWYQGKPTENVGQYWWLLSGRMEVLSAYQVEQRMQCCRDRGEIVDFQFADALPEGSIVCNLR
jgi:hypothetical protein